MGIVCINCGKALSKGQRKYCSPKCSGIYWKGKYLKMNPLKGKSSATTGTISELRVAIDLLTKEYDVFYALSPNSPCDLAVLKKGKLLRIEVRTALISASGKLYKTKSNRDDAENIDHYAWVLPDKIIYDPELG